MPFVELDALHHGPNWTEATAEELRARVEPLVADDGWVIDGGYWGKIGDLVLRHADLVVWLDLPVRVWLPRLIRRTVRRVRAPRRALERQPRVGAERLLQPRFAHLVRASQPCAPPARLSREARALQRRPAAIAEGGGAMAREVRLSSADRVLFPDDGITKGDLFDYYGRIAPALVPHLRDRPFTMKRWREGIAGGSFFQKQVPKGMPDWLPTRTFTTHPRPVRESGGSREVDFPLVDSREALQLMVQFHCIDMNAWYSRVDKPDRPDYVLFDLDPPDGEFPLAVQAALLVRDALDELELRSYVKTSGSEGIHVLVPITRRYGFRQTHAFAELVSKRLAAENPGVITTEWLKRKRVGVLLDYHQNGAGKTIASAYSVRPKPGAPVSTPLHWEELTAKLDPAGFTMEAVLQRVESTAISSSRCSRASSHWAPPSALSDVTRVKPRPGSSRPCLVLESACISAEDGRRRGHVRGLTPGMSLKDGVARLRAARR